MYKLRLFALSFLITTVALVTLIFVNRPKPTPVEAHPTLLRVADDVFITSQLNPDDVGWLRIRGVKTIVDIRPDGEAKDQASSAQIELQTKLYQLNFDYIPVPHESIPKDAADSLGDVLSHQPKPAVLYCRTGRRAVRLFALAEASQLNGPTADGIREMVRKAGFSADDLQDEIGQRISSRAKTQAAKQ